MKVIFGYYLVADLTFNTGLKHPALRCMTDALGLAPAWQRDRNSSSPISACASTDARRSPASCTRSARPAA